MKKQNIIFAVLFLAAITDGFVWQGIARGASLRPGDYFLDVGQGDSELIVLPDGARILTDAGPDASVVAQLSKILPSGDQYIDLAIITHPQSDHYNGYNFLLDHVRVGAFLVNGRDDAPTVASWQALKEKIKNENVPVVVVARGDTIKTGDSKDNILSPNSELAQSAELNDTGIVERIVAPKMATLLTADIGTNVEQYLIGQYGANLRADILKVAHHGSRYSSSAAFLRAVSPEVAVIEVGAHNTYGHPASSTLARITSGTQAKILRTDLDGNVSITGTEGKLLIYNKK